MGAFSATAKLFISGCTVALLLLSACLQRSPFDDKLNRAIISLADERRTNDLLDLAVNASEEQKILIARSFAAIQDSLALPLIRKWLGQGGDEDLRNAAAFALGQYRSEQQLPILDSAYRLEQSAMVKASLLKAIGKSKGEAWLVKNCVQPDNPDAAAFAEAFAYCSLSRLSVAPLIKLAATGNEETAFAALFALARFKESLQGHIAELRQISARFTTGKILVPVAACLAKAGREGNIELEQIFKKQSEPLDRILILNTLNPQMDTSCKSVVKKGLADHVAMVREAAMNRLALKPELFNTAEILQMFNAESYPQVKYGLAGLLISGNHKGIADSLSAAITAKIKEEKDPYTAGYQCMALAGSWKNLPVLEELMFSTPDILVRQFAFEGILRLRSSTDFTAYATAWKQQFAAGKSLHNHIADIIRSACETRDVSLLALASVFMRDTTLPATTGKFPFEWESTGFLEKALERLKLPRDIETYSEVLKTLRFYQGKPVSGTIRPEFNSPVDWDLVLRIPENQQVIVETDSGNLTLEIWPLKAPGTCARFIRLIKEGYYNNKRVHRVVPGFVMQTGCPRGDGFGSLMETIRAEFHESAEFKAGTIGMASAGPDTESCQWFITHTPTPHLNGRYTAFGRVTEGLEQLSRMTRGTRIRSVRLLD